MSSTDGHYPMHVRRRPLLRLGLAFIAITIPLIHAQAPASMRRMGFTQLNDKLYIQGGYDTDTSSRFVSLDLASSWSTNAASFTTLKDGQSTSHLTLTNIPSSTNGGSQGSILAIGGMNLPMLFSIYDVGAVSWANLTTVKPTYSNLEGHSAVTDPNTGLIYIIGGFSVTPGINPVYSYNAMTVFDPKTRRLVSQENSNAGDSLTDVGAVWSRVRNTIVTFGGSRIYIPQSRVKGMGDADLSEYDPASKSWKIWTTTGDIPPPRLDHCMAESEDGSKIVVFGGTSDGDSYYNSIYILDIKTGKWKAGESSPTARTRMACTVHSYQFVAWGGSSGSARSTMLNNLPVVYNLNKDEWTDKYDADEKASKSSVGGIIGGLIAVIAVGALVAFYMIRQRRKKRVELEAYNADAMAAEAMARREDDNIKVPADDYPYTSPHLPQQPVNGYKYGNDYPLTQIDLNSPHVMNSAQVRYGPDGSPTHTATSGSTATEYGHSQYLSPSVGGSSLQVAGGFSPAPSHYVGTTPGYSHSTLQSPAASYQLYAMSPSTSATTSGVNPFMSPDDYYHPPPSHMMPTSSPFEPAPVSSPGTSASANPATDGADPFMRATVAVAATAVATEYRNPNSPAMRHRDPFQQQSSSMSPSLANQQAWVPPPPSGMSYTTSPSAFSPSPGARAPQEIPESNSTGFVSPP